MKTPLLIAALFVLTELTAQNVGIGTPLPVEKLDVNGNINLSGTIKANGVSGQQGQALMTNGSGSLIWSYPNEYKNFITFSDPGSGTWIIPAGVTKIYAEAWGGGGGATGTGGGGGGGYVGAILTVVPGGSVSYTVGAAGNGGAPNATDGGYSQVFYSPVSIMAFGGTGNTYTSFGNTAPGGGFTGSNGTAYLGEAGEAGGLNTFGYHQSNATTFLESQSGGKGGDAGHTRNTGGKGTYQIRNAATSAIVYALFGSHGRIPGGGGGGNITWGGSVRNGAPGMVRIHY